VEFLLSSLHAGLQSADRFPRSAPCNMFISRGFQRSLMVFVHSGMQSTPGRSVSTITGLRRVIRRIVVLCLRWSRGVTLNGHHYYQFSHHAGDAVDLLTVSVHVIIDDMYFYGRRSGSGELYSVHVLGLGQFVV